MPTSTPGYPRPPRMTGNLKTDPYISKLPLHSQRSMKGIGTIYPWIPPSGHRGFFQTLHLPQKAYWWPWMSTFVWKFIMGCATCQMAKVNTHITIPGLSPLAVESSTLLSSIYVDLISGLSIFPQFWLCYGCGRPLPYEGGNLLPMH